ncbi:peptidylprolyl isomerase [Flavobacterium sp.]|jgi:peptidyl-prolyl cis-trans isomerase A (cyclophilin A)|uniref:peptidylprolyl isomerase n=1 Tax=Flavobacterium sp. TaxID=239 RepID=UPI0037C131F6
MKMKFLIVIMLLASSVNFAQENATSEGIFAEIETTKGKIVIDLTYKKTPVTVANFISLAEGKNPDVSPSYKGKMFYDGLKFHRVISDFMIQGGDPVGNGSGDPGYKFRDEITDLKHDAAGILSMANSGPNTNGSQFFITHKPTPHLDGKHAVFGKVVSGMDVVNSIVQNDVMTKITIIRKGTEAKKFDAVKVFTTAREASKIAAQKEAKDREMLTAAALKAFEKGKTTASGLKYVVIKEGSGERPVATSNVKVHYVGTLTNGTEFDSSVKRGEPIDFGLNQVIPGWTEGLQLMTEGSKYKFYIPYTLAYGERAMGNVIPAKSDLIFEVELLKINK